MGGELLLGAAIAFFVAAITTPVGVSGAVFLVPVQVSVLGVANLAVTPTNLLFNVIAIPGAMYRFSKAGSLWNPLTKILVLTSAPGVVLGAVLRAEVLSGSTAFYLVIAAVLGPLGAWMLLSKNPNPEPWGDGRSMTLRIGLLAFVVGVVGGIYGIGGGSILAPILVGLGYRVAMVAPAALTSTFATSIVGIASFVVIDLGSDRNLMPDWSTGIAMGAGGIVGAFVGASLQGRLPEPALRRLLGSIAIALAVFYVASVV